MQSLNLAPSDLDMVPYFLITCDLKWQAELSVCPPHCARYRMVELGRVNTVEIPFRKGKLGNTWQSLVHSNDGILLDRYCGSSLPWQWRIFCDESLILLYWRNSSLLLLSVASQYTFWDVLYCSLFFISTSEVGEKEINSPDSWQLVVGLATKFRPWCLLLNS